MSLNPKIYNDLVNISGGRISDVDVRQVTTLAIKADKTSDHVERFKNLESFIELVRQLAIKHRAAKFDSEKEKLENLLRIEKMVLSMPLSIQRELSRLGRNEAMLLFTSTTPPYDPSLRDIVRMNMHSQSNLSDNFISNNPHLVLPYLKSLKPEEVKALVNEKMNYAAFTTIANDMASLQFLKSIGYDFAKQSAESETFLSHAKTIETVQFLINNGAKLGQEHVVKFLIQDRLPIVEAILKTCGDVRLLPLSKGEQSVIGYLNGSVPQSQQKYKLMQEHQKKYKDSELNDIRDEINSKNEKRAPAIVAKGKEGEVSKSKASVTSPTKVQKSRPKS